MLSLNASTLLTRGGGLEHLVFVSNLVIVNGESDIFLFTCARTKDKIQMTCSRGAYIKSLVEDSEMLVYSQIAGSWAA